MKRDVGIGLAIVALVAVLANGCGTSAKSSGFTGTTDGGGTGNPDGSGSPFEGGEPPLDATLGGGEDSAPHEAGLSDASLASDGEPDVEGGACVVGDAAAPPYPQRCVTATNNECDGPTDQALTALGVPMSLLNGMTGNGFDDDCDGLVDEGCPCPGNGQTKNCYLVPATQADPATKTPVGWCTTNSLGSLDCAGTEFPTWSGVCRGAQPPYAHDVCAPGDFNCDGLAENSDTMNCACMPNIVACPTMAITEQPYPDPSTIQVIDGSQWITAVNQRPNAMNWTWTVIGGDCDNVLPNPTYAVYNATNSTTAARVGTRTPVVYNMNANPARYQAMAGQPLISIQAVNYGNGVAGGQVYPAFGLSGDYIVQGEWDLGGTHYVCTQKVQVRAPGVRAELCWDTVGGEESASPAGNDLDLHLSRLQGVTCAKKGWDTTCPQGQTYEDCYYNSSSGCRDFSPWGPGWGYADSAASACIGWSSKRQTGPGYQGCTNPRLDKDNIECDKTVADPTQNGLVLGNEFCGPENINLDNPNDGDSFAVAVNHYANHGGTADAHPHVNLYCNGERVLSAGYNPVTGQTTNPLLKSQDGFDSTGDFWEVGTIQVAAGDGGSIACTVATVPSHHADQVRDGVTNPTSLGNQLCVDSVTSNANPAYNYTTHEYIEHAALQGGANGGIPPTIGGFCKH